MAEAQEGQKVRLKDGTIAVVKNGQLVAVPAAPGAPTPKPRMSTRDQINMDIQRAGARSGDEAKRRAAESAQALKRLGSGPFKGLVLDAALPVQGGGWLDKIGATVIGAPLRGIGAITPEIETDYQTVNRNMALGTRQSETGEKGTQTEGDAARAMLSELTPGTASPETIQRSIDDKADRQIGRANFYSRWADTYGTLDGTDQQGRGVEKAYQDHLAGAAVVPPGGLPAPQIRRVQ